MSCLLGICFVFLLICELAGDVGCVANMAGISRAREAAEAPKAKDHEVRDAPSLCCQYTMRYPRAGGIEDPHSIIASDLARNGLNQRCVRWSKSFTDKSSRSDMPIA